MTTKASSSSNIPSSSSKNTTTSVVTPLHTNATSIVLTEEQCKEHVKHAIHELVLKKYEVTKEDEIALIKCRTEKDIIQYCLMIISRRKEQGNKVK